MIANNDLMPRNIHKSEFMKGSGNGSPDGLKCEFYP